MKVKAIETGFYGNKRRKPFDTKHATFTLQKVSDFSSSWMRVVTATPAEKEELKKILEKRQADMNDPKPKRIIVSENLFAKAGLDVSDEEQFDELFDEDAGKVEAIEEKKAEKKAKASKRKSPEAMTEAVEKPSGVVEEEAL